MMCLVIAIQLANHIMTQGTVCRNHWLFLLFVVGSLSDGVIIWSAIIIYILLPSVCEQHEVLLFGSI